jgi:site-specific DNA-methyltransferase (adenine-specific)
MTGIQLDTITCMDALELCHAVADAGIQVDMILADLPYGTTACAWDTVIPFEPMWAAFRRVAKPNAPIVLTAAEPFSSALVTSNIEEYRHVWVWDKGRAPNFLNANREPLRMHENVLVFSQAAPNYYPQMRFGPLHRRGGSKNQNNGTVYGEREPVTSESHEYYPDTFLRFPTIDNAKKTHPTEKPVALFEYLIRTYSQPGDVVLDPVVGSGTTSIAARNTDRRYLCGDILPEHVALAIRRVLDTDGFRHRRINERYTQRSIFADEQQVEAGD